MGLLSSVLSIGGAAIGAAVGGPAGAKIGGAIGGAVGGAVSGSKGSSKATKAQLEANAEAQRKAEAAKNEAIGYQQPYLDFGTSSTNALTSRLGLPAAAPRTAASANALTTGGGLASAGTGGGTGSAIAPGASTRDGIMYSASGAPIGYADDFGAGRPGTVSAPAGGATGAEALPLANAPPPAAPAATAPGVDPGTYGSATNPAAPTPYAAPDAPDAYSGPAPFSFSVQDFQNSPILQAAIKRGLDTTQSSTAAQGSLFSGATLKALTDNALTTSYKFFDNERNFAAGRYDNQRDFDYGLSRDARRDYEDTRGFDYGQSRDERQDYQDTRDYLTDRFDEQTNNLFRGVGVGQGAAGAATSAATRYGDQAVGLVTDAGQVKAQNALTQGQIGSDLATGLGGIIAGAIPGTAPTVSRNALNGATRAPNNIRY